ncbi:MAG: hypothetical protein M3258_06705 [Thermoproteota archaeon]|nr:hypothetical protein [Thermoproteota archaeon]
MVRSLTKCRHETGTVPSRSPSFAFIDVKLKRAIFSSNIWNSGKIPYRTKDERNIFMNFKVEPFNKNARTTIFLFAIIASI